MEDEKLELQAPKKEYVINIRSNDKNREIRLSAGLVNFGMVSLILGAIIFVGACGYSVYSALNYQKNIDAVIEIQQAEQMQQEQLLTISKKADALGEILHNLVQQEEELRIQAGLEPPKEDVIADDDDLLDDDLIDDDLIDDDLLDDDLLDDDLLEETPPDGQGGPIGNLNVDDVAEALAMVEQRAMIRAESLGDFQRALKIRREQWSVIADVSNIVPDMITIDGGFMPSYSPTFSLDLSQFGGSPSANPNIPSIWPTTGVVTSPYGLRWGGTDFHPGIDIADEMGTPIVATADGIVEYAGWNSGGYGNMVDINHGNGIMTRYGHASQVVVSNGQYVKRGQVIAYMGSTGFSTGPHVHYEVHVNGQRVNPISYL